MKNSLPKELVWKILLFLPTKSVVYCLCVNKHWNSVSINDMFWKDLCFSRFSSILKESKIENFFKEGKCWKMAYISCFDSVCQKVSKINLNYRENSILLKCILCGSYGVGKTSLIYRYSRGLFREVLEYTIGGAMFPQKKVIIKDREIFIDLWDTAGQERYADTLSPMYFRGSNIIVLCFDLTRLESFEKMNKWLLMAKDHSYFSSVIIVCGCKCDLVDMRVVSDEVIKNFTKKNGLRYFETSSKKGINISEMFTTLIRMNVNYLEFYEREYGKLLKKNNRGESKIEKSKVSSCKI